MMLFKKPPDGCERFTISVEMNKRWIPYFLSMLEYMEHLGRVGSSRKVSFYADGDGDFHPKFKMRHKFIPQEPNSDDRGNRLYDAG